MFGSAVEFQDDKRRWSRFSSLEGEVVGCGPDACDDGESIVSEADSRGVGGEVAELEGD
jgi:hypothetical protein